LTVFPLIALIRNHDVPATVLPAHVARHLPPVTVAATDTLVPTRTLVLVRAVVAALVRRLTPHRVALVVVAPNASLGIDTAATAKTKTADRSALARMAGRDAWGERRIA
jgi:RecB family exonuclease